MTNKYRSWCQNPIITSTNGSSYYRIFENFPNNIKMWNIVYIHFRQQKFRLFFSTISFVQMTFHYAFQFCLYFRNDVFLVLPLKVCNRFYVTLLFNASPTTSFLSASAAPIFLSVSLIYIFARTRFFSAVFSLLVMFCPVFSWILDYIISLILSRTLHPKASTSLLTVSASQLDFTLNLEFFSKNPVFFSVKYTLFCIFLKKISEIHESSFFFRISI